MLRRQEIRPDMPGYYKKNENRYRYCGNFHDEGFRCTREMGHKGDHAAHVPMGVPDSTEEIKDAEGNIIDVRTKPGMQNTINMQIATWSK
jgi:hypothetical protein